LVGSAGPNFNTSLQSTVTGRALAASRLSFLSLQLYVPNSWGAAASDFYVYYPPNTPRWKIFSLTLSGLCLSFWFVNLLGIGLGCGVAVLPAWADAYAISSGALINAGYAPLGGFGKFCSVIVALGGIANCVPGTYSAAIGCQIMGRWGQMLPRWIWVVILCIIQLVCGVAGRNQLFIIFTNFLALMGYWLSVMICIVAEEHAMFLRGRKLDWTAWNDKNKLPVGLAALMAFLLGWMGAILGMYEVSQIDGSWVLLRHSLTLLLIALGMVCRSVGSGVRRRRCWNVVRVSVRSGSVSAPEMAGAQEVWKIDLRDRNQEFKPEKTVIYLTLPHPL